MLLFVYGTLMKGCNNHWLLKELGARYIGRATARGYTITVDIIPFMYPAPQNCSVEGEVYEVPREAIPELDDFEYGYVRLPIRVELESGEEIEAHAYLADDTPLDECILSKYTC